MKSHVQAKFQIRMGRNETSKQFGKAQRRLSDIERFEWGNAVIISNDRHGEVRFVAYGYIDNRLHVVVYTIRTNTTRRVISIRRGNLREERYYAEAKAWDHFTDS